MVAPKQQQQLARMVSPRPAPACAREVRVMSGITMQQGWSKPLGNSTWPRKLCCLTSSRPCVTHVPRGACRHDASLHHCCSSVCRRTGTGTPYHPGHLLLAAQSPRFGGARAGICCRACQWRDQPATPQPAHLRRWCTGQGGRSSTSGSTSQIPEHPGYCCSALECDQSSPQTLPRLWHVWTGGRGCGGHPSGQLSLSDPSHP
jgi:hypothetical protein